MQETDAIPKLDTHLRSHAQFNKFEYVKSTDTANCKSSLYEQPSEDPLKIEIPEELFKTSDGHGIATRLDMKIEEFECTETIISGGTFAVTEQPIESLKMKTTTAIVNCDHIAAEATQLEEHVRIQPGGKTYTCINIYDYIIKKQLRKSKAHKVNHVSQESPEMTVRKHAAEKVLKCLSCSYSSTRPDYLVQHLRTHSEEKSLKCCKCDKIFANRISLALHMRGHTGERPFKCTVCDYSARQSILLKIHMKKHTGEKPFKCTMCDRAFVTRSHLTDHMRRHTGEWPLKCSKCEYTCTRRAYLTAHMRKHTRELKQFMCQVCSYAGGSRSILKVHMRTHTGQKPFKCTFCDYACNQRSNLQHHIKTHTGEKPHKCTVCDYASTQRYAIKEHMRTHTGEKPYKCTVCDYGSTFRNGLVQHMKNHTGEKPFLCHMCGYATTMLGKLAEHMMSHTGRKKGLCNICGISVSQYGLKNHMRTHTAERPFKCTLCSYAAGKKTHLTRHMKTHTKEKPSRRTVFSKCSMNKSGDGKPSASAITSAETIISGEEEDIIVVQTILKKPKLIVMSPIRNINEDDVGGTDDLNEDCMGAIDHMIDVHSGNQVEEEVSMDQMGRTMNQSAGVMDEIPKTKEVTKTFKDVSPVWNISEDYIGDTDDINEVDGGSQVEEEVIVVVMKQATNQCDGVRDEENADTLAAIAALREELKKKEKLWMEEKMKIEERIHKLENKIADK